MQGFILPFFIQRRMEGDDIGFLDQRLEGAEVTFVAAIGARWVAEQSFDPQRFQALLQSPANVTDATIPTVRSRSASRRVQPASAAMKDVLYHRNGVTAWRRRETNPRLLQPRLIDVIGAGGSGADELNGLAGEQCFIDPGDRARPLASASVRHRPGPDGLGSPARRLNG